MCICFRPVLFAAVLVIAIVPLIASASAPPQAQNVLAQEHRRFVAVAAGSASALCALLDEDFSHVTVRGALLYRAEEVARIATAQTAFKPSEQTVDLIGNVAIVHGVLTPMHAGARLARRRYIDVYYLVAGSWLLKTEQETAIAGP